jgi:hypothetical protein
METTWTRIMIVLGADAHKRSHTIAAVQTATGQVLGDETAAATARGFGVLLVWARDLDRERVWALEDCRHASGALERFLIARGERVVRVSTQSVAAACAVSDGGLAWILVASPRSNVNATD